KTKAIEQVAIPPQIFTGCGICQVRGLVGDRPCTSSDTTQRENSGEKQKDDWIGLDWIGLDWIGLDCKLLAMNDSPLIRFPFSHHSKFGDLFSYTRPARRTSSKNVL